MHFTVDLAQLKFSLKIVDFLLLILNNARQHLDWERPGPPQPPSGYALACSQTLKQTRYFI